MHVLHSFSASTRTLRMEPVGFVASLLALVQTAEALYKSIHRLQLNAQRRSHLRALVGHLVEVLESAGSVSCSAEKFVHSSLQEIKAMLEPPRERHRISKIFLGCITALRQQAKLDEAERQLANLKTEVVVVANILQLKKEGIGSIFNGRMELPPSHVGLDRAKSILEFLQVSNSVELRVIGIYGLAGVGKTTLLNYIWQQASAAVPFHERAHVQIGHSETLQICSLQSSILQQLGGGRNEFTSPEGGKQKMSEHFQQLRDDERPVFLAIDNVFDVEDLQKLLPFNLSEDLLPASSCIAVTCRNFRVIEALLNICHLQRENHLQVLCYTPPCLDLEESKKVFAACGDLCATEDAELLDTLVPLCKGLPLALTVLGKIFAGNAKRERKEWEVTEKQMQVMDGDDAETRLVTNSLRLSYEKLTKSRQAAFLDVVNFFYGWPWETVERILGVSVLKDLKDSSLLSEADDWSKCNQSALRAGFRLDMLDCEIYEPSMKKVVTMHDLTLKFGECLRTLPVTIHRNFPSSKGPLENLEASKLKHLVVWRDNEADSALEFLQRTTNLQMLLLRDDKHSLREKILKANWDVDERCFPRSGPQCLRYLRLDGWESSRLIMEMKISTEIREIHLHDCPDVEQLPDTPLHQLEWLSISGCEKFQGFSISCVASWRKLKYLEVGWCNSITNIPSELGDLGNLRVVRFRGCLSLKSFPSLRNPEGPSHLLIKECPSLTTLPPINCPLETLELDIPFASVILETTARKHLQKFHFEGACSIREIRKRREEVICKERKTYHSGRPCSATVRRRRSYVTSVMQKFTRK